MFLLGKLLGLITQPLNWVALCLLLGLVVLRSKPRLGQRLVAAAVVMLACMGWLALPDAGVRALESRYAELALDADLSGYTGVVLLGGAMGAGHIAQAHYQPILNDSAERMTAAAAFLMRYPKMQVVFTGGEGTLLGTGPSEAERAKVFFSSLNVANDRVQYESASRNTYDNAILTAQLPGVQKTHNWLLLTSAWHMPRSMATFEKAGWHVTAYPVDFRTGDSTPWTDFNFAQGAERWNLLLHEWVGWLSYRLTGRL